jgi:Uma2 family endonuclease
MGETGILAPDRGVQLIDGEIIDMAPPGDPRIGTVDQLAKALGSAAAERAHVRVHNPLWLSDHSEPQPDVSVLNLASTSQFIAALDRRMRCSWSKWPIHRCASIAGRKSRSYGRHAIPEVWLVDVRAKCLVRYRDPQQGAYTLVDEPDLGFPLEIAAVPEARVDLDTLFD